MDGGGALVFAGWRVTEPDFIVQYAAMEAAPTGVMNLTFMEVEDAGLAAGLSTTTIPLVNPGVGWGIFSFGLEATGGGVELAHFYGATPVVTTHAAIVSGHGGRTMALGFPSDVVEGSDGVRLMRNILEQVLLAASP